MRDLLRLALVAILAFAVVGTAMVYSRGGDLGESVVALADQARTAVTNVAGGNNPPVDATVTGSTDVAATELKVLRPLQRSWIGLAGFPDETQIRFAVPPGVSFTSGELNLAFQSELAEHGDGRMTIAVNGRDREQVVLNSGKASHAVKIALDASDLLGEEVNVTLIGRGNTNSGQICPTDAANSGSAVTLMPESALSLVTYDKIDDPETALIAASGPMNLVPGLSTADAAAALWADQQLARAGIASTLDSADQMGTRVLVANVGAAPVSRLSDTSFQLAGQPGVERLIALRAAERQAPALATHWPVDAATLGGETIVKNFRGSKRWTIDYKLADLPGGLMPGRLNLAVKMSELAEDRDWVLRITLNNNLLDSRRIDGKAKSIDLPIDLPADQQGLANRIQIELVDTSPNESICRAGPDAQAQLLPTTTLTPGVQPSEGWGPMVRELANAASVGLVVEGKLNAAESSRASAMLAQFLPVAARMAFGDDKAAVSLTVVTESTLTDALRKVSLLTPDSAAKAGAGKLLILSAQAGSFDPIAIHDLDRTDLSSLIAGMKRSDVAFLVQRH